MTMQGLVFYLLAPIANMYVSDARGIGNTCCACSRRCAQEIIHPRLLYARNVYAAQFCKIVFLFFGRRVILNVNSNFLSTGMQIYGFVHVKHNLPHYRLFACLKHGSDVMCKLFVACTASLFNKI